MHDRGLSATDALLASAYMDDHISILIGTDQYWHLTAVESLLGWTLQGSHTNRRDHPLAELSALTLAHGESPPDDITTDKLSSPRPDVRKKSMQCETPLPEKKPGLHASADVQKVTLVSVGGV